MRTSLSGMALVALFCTACGGSDSTDPYGETQRTTIQVSGRALNTVNSPVQGLAVTFGATESVQSPTVHTDADGRYAVSWTIDCKPGVTILPAVVVGGLRCQGPFTPSGVPGCTATPQVVNLTAENCVLITGGG